MTQDEQQQMDASFAYFGNACANLAKDGANAAMAATALSIKVKALTEEVAALKAKLPPEPASNVVPITEPAA